MGIFCVGKEDMFHPHMPPTLLELPANLTSCLATPDKSLELGAHRRDILHEDVEELVEIL